MTLPRERWTPAHVDRRATERAEYRRTAPGLLEIEDCRCAVRDLGLGGFRVEPAPSGRVWHLDQQVTATVMLRSGERVVLEARIGRIDRAGLAFFPIGGRWANAVQIEGERQGLRQRQRERRTAPRLPIPLVGDDAKGARTPLRDISATGLRYALTRFESAPAVGSRIEGALQLDTETSIDVRGRVARNVGREIAVAFDPPGLDPAVLELLRVRFFPSDRRQ